MNLFLFPNNTAVPVIVSGYKIPELDVSNWLFLLLFKGIFECGLDIHIVLSLCIWYISIYSYLRSNVTIISTDWQIMMETFELWYQTRLTRLYSEDISEELNDPTDKSKKGKEKGVTEMIVLSASPDLLHLLRLQTVHCDWVLVITNMWSSYCHRPPYKLLNIQKDLHCTGTVCFKLNCGFQISNFLATFEV